VGRIACCWASAGRGSRPSRGHLRWCVVVVLRRRSAAASHALAPSRWNRWRTRHPTLPTGWDHHALVPTEGRPSRWTTRSSDQFDLAPLSLANILSSTPPPDLAVWTPPQTPRRRDPAVRCAVRRTIELQAYLHRTGKGRAGATVPLSSSRVLELQAAAPGKGRAPAADAKAVKLQPCAALEDAPSSFRAPCVTSSLPRELDHCGLGAHEWFGCCYCVC
jgi:hypothetical protein